MGTPACLSTKYVYFQLHHIPAANTKENFEAEPVNEWNESINMA